MHLQLARGSQDLRDGVNGHKVQLEDILPVRNEGRDANLEGRVDACGGVGRPATTKGIGAVYTQQLQPQCLEVDQDGMNAT